MLGGQRILESSTVELMRAVTLPGLAPNQGLGFYWDRASGRDVVGHNGGEVGAYADFFLDPATGIGVLVVANAEPDGPDGGWPIVERLFDEAPGLAGTLFEDNFESGDTTAWSAAVD